jgi:hypothetical protein
MVASAYEAFHESLGILDASRLWDLSCASAGLETAVLGDERE